MTFATEAEMVASWLRDLKRTDSRGEWTVYAETAGWDLLLVHRKGWQLGIEAKMLLNPKVLDQALDGAHRYWRCDGPDYRAVLVPHNKVQGHMGRICKALGIVILPAWPEERTVIRHIGLPSEDHAFNTEWPHWCPGERCKLPEYIPDVSGGHASPVQLTEWKIQAIKLMLILERRGFVTRQDMKALKISPTRWIDNWVGFLGRSPSGYIPNARTPDLKVQHPINWAQIEADMPAWIKLAGIVLDPLPTLI